MCHECTTDIMYVSLITLDKPIILCHQSNVNEEFVCFIELLYVNYQKLSEDKQAINV